MKKILALLPALLLACTLIVGFSSCDKDEGKLPDISFKTGAAYTSASATAAKSTAYTVGINAAKTEGKDVLTKFTITRSYDGAADETVLTNSLSGSQGDSYTYDHMLTTRNQAGTEKYTFTVVNKDGITNSINLTLTVQ